MSPELVDRGYKVIEEGQKSFLVEIIDSSMVNDAKWILMYVYLNPFKIFPINLGAFMFRLLQKFMEKYSSLQLRGVGEAQRMEYH